MAAPEDTARRAPMVRSFSSLEDAVAARDALAASGVARELLEVTVLEDEAGPVAGSLAIGNGGAYLLTLHHLGPTQRSVAESVLAGFDAVAVTELARAGQER